MITMGQLWRRKSKNGCRNKMSQKVIERKKTRNTTIELTRKIWSPNIFLNMPKNNTCVRHCHCQVLMLLIKAATLVVYSREKWFIYVLAETERGDWSSANQRNSQFFLGLCYYFFPGLRKLVFLVISDLVSSHEPHLASFLSFTFFPKKKKKIDIWTIFDHTQLV